MCRSGKKVHPLGLDRVITQVVQTVYVPGQGSRVAGDIDDSLRRHTGQNGRHMGRESFPGWVHTDYLGTDALFRQLLGHRPGVAAEKLRVVNSVAFGIFFGILNGLGDDFRPDDPPGPPCQGQGDGADAAVQVQNDLRPGEPGKVQAAAYSRSV